MSDFAATARHTIRAMRPHQWTKNLLVFVPMVTAHAWAEPSAWRGALIVFACFCATASGIYIVNDLSDIEADRQHPRKRFRPLASGALSIAFGIALAAALLLAGLGLAIASGALLVVLAYAALSILYSMGLKRFPLVDVFVLAALYTLRVLAGGVATGHKVTLWLMAFSGFTFLSLALLKRSGEMLAAIQQGDFSIVGRRGYLPQDVTILQMFGCGAAFSSSVVLALFVGSTIASANYRWPELLWGVVPLVLFWHCRMWLATVRGYMEDDPIVYASRDWVSWIVAACTGIVLLLATV